MAVSRRDWTAEIQGNGHGTLWAWVAYNPKLGTFATANRDHARRFSSKQDVEDWITRLKVGDAKAIRLKD